ncbi:hypothetical protein GCM10011313_17520 [Mycetocola zhadangensis]|nr:hypothetical protein GCM10011313_17520 [Mycetocola zhadangensis]
MVACCRYVLSGLNTDLKKLGRLTNREFVADQLLILQQLGVWLRLT